MVARRQIILPRSVAVAGVQELAGAVDAQPLDRVARPAAAVAFAREAVLGRQHAVAAIGRDMALEIGFAAKQAKPVLDLPLDARTGAAARLRERGRREPSGEQQGGEAENEEFTHDGPAVKEGTDG